MKQIHYINGKVVNPPVNYEDIDISINFDPDDQETNLSITSFDWADEEANILRGIYNNGLSGGRGVYEGVPHTIEVVENGTTLTLLNGYIDLTTAQWDDDRVVVDSKPISELDWLNEVADSVTFEFLYQRNFLSVNDVVFVPYVINSVPNYKDILITTITLVTITNQVKEISFKLPEASTESATLVDSIGGVIKLIYTILYAAALILTIIDLILDLANLMIQRVKYVAAMKVNTQIQAACNYLGVKYESDFLKSAIWNRLHIIPECFAPPETQTDNRIKGYLQGNKLEQTGYYKGTFGDLLRNIGAMFNARIVSNGTELKILQQPKKLTGASFQLPDYDVTNFTTNARDIIGNYSIAFSTDQVDKNTLDQWQGTEVFNYLYPKNIGDKRLKLISGQRKVQLPFARAIRKNSLTIIEEYADLLLDGVDAALSVIVLLINGVIAAVNAFLDAIKKIKNALSTVGINIPFSPPGITPLKQPELDSFIDNRIGMLVLEQDMIGVPKIALIEQGTEDRKTKIAADNQAVIKAKFIYERFHASESFAPKNNSAQRIEWQFNNVEMNLADVIKVKTESAVKMPDGTIAEVINCSWNSSTRLANFVVRQRKLFTNNIQEVIYEPSGR